MIRVGSLCSGYGGLETAVQAVLGGLVAWHAEVDPAASLVLKRAEPGVPNHGDLKLLPTPDVEPVDLLAMGVPCQPASAAGRQLGESDPRWLWPDARRVIRALRPPAFLFENVEGLVTMRKGEVWRSILADMRADGYAVRWLVMGACVVGAPHHRHRLFALGAHVGPATPAAVRLDVPKCGVGRDGALLHTPRAGDGDGKTGASAARSDGYGPAGLAAQLALLPTPVVTDAKGTRNATANRPPGKVANSGATLTDAITLLPTPLARDAERANEGSAEYWARPDKVHRAPPLGAVITLLSTPQARDAIGGRLSIKTGTARLESGRRNLDDAVGALLPLLPTPTASEHTGAGHAANGGINLRTAVIGERFGKYSAAVERWAQLCGVDPPEPTERGPRGGLRLAPAFPAWMMGLDIDLENGLFAGAGRTDVLRMVGNGVMPQQGAAALCLLLDPGIAPRL